MGTVEERRRNDEKVAEVIALAANGNKDAENYLADFAYACRVFDDLIDKDHEVTDKQIYKAFFILMAGLWMNPFFRRNFLTLISVHIVSINTFIDSNKWEKESGTKSLYAHVIKDSVDELFGVVAFLTGGYHHMRKVSLIMREVFLEEVNYGTMQ